MKDCVLHSLPHISIHAPTRGATYAGDPTDEYCKFQSTLPREERRACHCSAARINSISIHAPTRGATRFHSVIPDSHAISIHAPTRGATLHSSIILSQIHNFNPRSHERSDSNIAQKICLFLYNTDNKYIIR